MRRYKNYMGIEGLTLVWYNNWDDNELVYDGIHADLVDIQEGVYQEFCEKFGVDAYTEDSYNFWVRRNPGVVIDYMEEMGDWCFENKTVDYGSYHTYLERWKYEQMLQEVPA